MKKISLLIIICFFLCSCSKYSTVSKEVIIDEFKPFSTKLTLTMVGDALIHSPIYKDAYKNGRYEFASIFEEVTSEFKRSDLLYYNQETILGGASLGYSGYPRFNTPSEFGRTMINMGFNLVSRANNHTLDKNEAGIINACNFWNQYPNVLTSGSVCTKEESLHPKIMEMNGIKYTLLSYTMMTNGLDSPNDYYVSLYSDEKVLEDILKVREEVDLIMVSMHWGDEYSAIPNEEQIRISEYLATLGVDIVIGTHPHTIEPIRWIGKTLVIYSLGNFLSSQASVDDYNRLIGLLVEVDIIKTVTKDRTKVELANLNTKLLYTHYKNNKNYKVIPFSKLNDDILKGFESLKIKYDSIVKYYDNMIPTS